MADRRMDPLGQLPESRRRVLELLKDRGRATTTELARALQISHEAARRQILQLVTDGLIEGDCAEPADEPTSGRPPVTYCLTVAGDHFFPKRYDELAVLLLDASADSGDTTEELLASVTARRLAQLPQRAGATLSDGIAALRATYLPRDPYLEIRRDGDDHVIIEKNCPFLAVALARPAICSTTVSLMRAVLGVEVVREERFQDGEGRCVFRGVAGQPVPPRRQKRFEYEPPKDLRDSERQR